MVKFDDALRALDERYVRLHREAKIPGLAWGVVRDGALAHTGGAGTIRDGEAVTPDADSVFRIASMTKSFTAAAVLLLREEGRLRLDDPAADHVPALAGWTGPTADAGPVRIRHLLTMSAGLPTDDPWGDRQQALPLDAFARLLETQPAFAWPPGTQFEYSNLGYGILGRVVTAASGQEYSDFVSERLLGPMGMKSSVYREEDVPAAQLAHGYVRHSDVLVREGTDGYGALASMGGLYSTVRDLALWVGGFLDAFPARDDPEGPQPLPRAARREMQQMHRTLPAAIAGYAAHEAPAAETAGYGLGLFMVSNGELGTRVSHGGGYPGFGSYMTWHPGTGIGVIALGNLRYAPVQRPAAEALGTLVRAAGAARRPRPLPALEQARELVERLLVRWDDGACDAAFAMNMDLDEPREGRRAAVARIVADIGPFRRDETRAVLSVSPAHLQWWLRGERGWLRVSILLSPEAAPRLQAVRLLAVPDPSPALRALAERLLAAASDPVSRWPDDVPAAPELDVAQAVRSLQAAAARLGALRLGWPVAGDGQSSATFEVNGDAAAGSDAGQAAPAAISVTCDATTGAVTAAVVRITDREAPVEAW